MKNPVIINENKLYTLRCKIKFLKKLLELDRCKLIKRKAQQTKDHDYIEKVKEKNLDLHKEILEELYK